MYESLLAMIDVNSFWSTFRSGIGLYDKHSVKYFPLLSLTVMISEFHVSGQFPVCKMSLKNLQKMGETSCLKSL